MKSKKKSMDKEISKKKKELFNKIQMVYLNNLSKKVDNNDGLTNESLERISLVLDKMENLDRIKHIFS